MNELVTFDKARKALQVCASVDEAKDILDQAEAMRVYAHQVENNEMEQWLSEIKLRARRRIGEISQTLETADFVNDEKGHRVPSGGKAVKRDALAAAGLSTSVANRCEKLAGIPEEKFEEIIADAKENDKPVTYADVEKAVNKDQNRKDRTEKIDEISTGNTEIGTGKTYPVIYADPPWQYGFSKSDSRKIENQYPTMTLDEICDLEVPASDDAILFLWTTSPKLEDSFKVVNAWGFEYKTCAVWDKQKIGMGYYFRQQHEILLVCKKGDIPAPDPANRPGSVFSFKRDKHSAKPHEVAEMIEAMYPEFSKLEIFCRSPRDGWDVWGNQSGA